MAPLERSFLKSALSRDELDSFVRLQGERQALSLLAPDGTFLRVNAELETLLGYTEAELKGHTVASLGVISAKTERSVAADDAMWRDLRAGRQTYRLRWLLTKDGRQLYLANRSYPIRDSRGRMTKVLVISVDVTKDYGEEASRRGRAQAIEATQAVIEFMPDGTITSANDLFLDAMGYAREEVIGRHHRLFCDASIMDEESYASFWEDLRRGALKAGQFKRRRRNGDIIYLQASYIAVTDADGRPMRIVKTAQDVTAEVLSRDEEAKVAATVQGKLGQIGDAVALVNTRAQSAADAASETSEAVQTAADTVEGFEAACAGIADAMGHSRDAVTKVKAEADAAGSHIGNLAEAAEAMSATAEIIQKVAGRINLLALNATIVSARAGEAGRGFAVVASEVKTLADQVAESTSTIVKNISGVQKVSKNVVGGLERIGDAVQLVDASVTGAGEAIVEQNAVARDIAFGMRTACTAVQRIDEDLGEIASAAATADAEARDGRALYAKTSALPSAVQTDIAA